MTNARHVVVVEQDDLVEARRSVFGPLDLAYLRGPHGNKLCPSTDAGLASGDGVRVSTPCRNHLIMSKLSVTGVSPERSVREVMMFSSIQEYLMRNKASDEVGAHIYEHEITRALNHAIAARSLDLLFGKGR